MTIGPHDVVTLPSGNFEVVGYPEDYTAGPFGYQPNFPTPHTVRHHVYSTETDDDYGREVTIYTPPLDEDGVEVAVYGWASPSSTEPKLAGHDRVLVEVEMYMPPGLVVNLRRVEG